MILHRSLIALSLLCAGTLSAYADSVAELSESFWSWRAQEQPFSNDDIPRIERPASFVVDWAPKTVAARLEQLTAFEQRWKKLSPATDAAIPAQVDYRLVGSAIARARWELSIEPLWKRDPSFYIDQTVGSVFVLLLPPPPFAEPRQQEIVSRMKRIPATIASAKENLTDMRQPFVQLALDGLVHITEQTEQMESALTPHLTATNAKALKDATPAAMQALADYRIWLEAKFADARKDTAIGRGNYLFFLRNVALLPYTPEQMLAMSKQEWDRTIAFESYQQNRLAGAPPAPIFPTAAAQIAAEARDEAAVRTFLVKERILSIPSEIKHYHNMQVPDYLEPYADLGVLDDLTGPSRLNEDGTSYIFKPRADLGYFYLSTARDPRPILVHEGVPGHYFQLTWGWNHPDPIRRHYYDSGANEGIGFYAEEMMLQQGYFDDNAQTRGTIYSFMRLRALRVEVDVKLALGEFTLQQAADYLARTVPMDAKTALEEASMFSSTPGQAISYQIGKLQIMQLLSDARQSQGKEFSLQKFHDFVWSNGNVPISMQRWELLGDTTQVPAVMETPAAQ